MADDLLGDILRTTTGENRASGIGDVLGQAVSRPARPAARVETPDLMPLAALDDLSTRALLRYLPSDLVVPLLAHAPVAVANRLVGAMDAEARAWLSSQNDEIEAVTPERHAVAATRALALLPRLANGPVRPAPPPRSLPVAPVETTFAVAPTPPSPAADPTLDLLVELVDAARGRQPGELRQLADGLDHPVLAEGLRRIADGTDPNTLDAAMRTAAAAHLIAEKQRLELICRAVMAISFGDHGSSLRT